MSNIGNRFRLWVIVAALASLGACDNEAPTARNAQAADPAALQRQVARLTVAVEDAEAVRAVKRLQHAYGYYSEFGLWNDFADLFADNAIGHYTGGPHTGKDAIRQHFITGVGQGMLGLAEGRLYPHISLSPVITLSPDGQTAQGRWRILAMLGRYGGNASWAGGVYENNYVKENGAWKIAEARFHSQYSGRYETGWRTSVDVEPTEPSVRLHFTPERAGNLVSERAAVDAEAAVVDIAVLRARVVSLEQRVKLLAAEIAAANLQHAYGYYADRKLWDDVADLFAEDGTMELGQQGVYVGQASIRRALDQFGPAGLRRGELNDGVQLQTIVSVAADAQTAKVRTTLLSMTGAIGEGGQWGQGAFENELVLDEGVWKIKTLRFYPRLITDYDQGWGKHAAPAPGPSADFAPDRDPTERYETYPKFFIPAFHFAHPVTGRPTVYPPGTEIAAATAVPAASVPAAASPLGTTGEIEAQLAALASTLAEIEAYDAAENLVNAHTYYLEEHLWGPLAELFAAEGWSEVAGAGVFAGRDRIRQALESVYGNEGRPRGFFAAHNVSQPVIHAAPGAESATFRTRLWQINSAPEGGGTYAAGLFQGQIVKDSGGWRIAALDFDPTWAATHVDGWARASGDAAVAAPRARTVFPADRPIKGPPSPPFPEIAQLTFHYRNPVSGREPAARWP
jgi:hypothetical protein